jgi:hypothetical protein
MASNYGLIELGLVFGFALAIGIWDIYKTRKSIARDRSTTPANASERSSDAAARQQKEND